VSSVPTLPLMAPEGVAFDPTKLAWIGAITRDVFVGYVWHTSAIQTLDDTKTREVIMGADSIGAAGANMAIVAREFLGLKLRLVLGYADSASVKLAMDKGEVDGTFANAWSDLKTVRPEWLRDHTVRIIVQHGLERIPDLPDVPSLIELAKTPEDREALEILDAPQDFQKPYFAPPGTPPARLDILRRAFDATVHDPAFLQAAAQTRLVVEASMRGEDLSARMEELAKTPRAAVKRLTDVFAKYK
jgi:tripartite-type tricarboxylate transporter receptor subunit TctC